MPVHSEQPADFLVFFVRSGDLAPKSIFMLRALASAAMSDQHKHDRPSVVYPQRVNSHVGQHRIVHGGAATGVIFSPSS